MNKSVPGNLRPSPMTYEVVRAPSLYHRRETLAAEADSLTIEDLRTGAESAQFDLTGASTKEEMVNAIRTQARGATAEPENV